MNIPSVPRDQPHDPTPMVYAGRSNQKHAHNTRHGVRYRNHWFNTYRCPLCGRGAARRRQPIICRGAEVSTI